MSWGYAFYDKNGRVFHDSLSREIRVVGTGSLRVQGSTSPYLINLRSYHPEANRIVLLGVDYRYTRGYYQYRRGRAEIFVMSVPFAGNIPFSVGYSGGYAYLNRLTMYYAYPSYRSHNVPGLSNNSSLHEYGHIPYHATVKDYYDLRFLVLRDI